MASRSITSCQIEGEKVEEVTDFLSWLSKIAVGGDCSREIRRWLLLGRKFMTNLDSVLKSRDITLPTKVCIVKAMVFPVVIYSFENWTVKKAECQRIDTFELWCWEKTPESPLDRKEVKPVNLKGDQPWIFARRTDAKAEAPVFWPSDANRQHIGKVLDAGRDWGQKEKRASEDEGWTALLIEWTWIWANSGRWWGTGRPGLLQSMGLQRVMTGWLNNNNIGN